MGCRIIEANVLYDALNGKAGATMRDVAAEPQRHGNHAIASGEKLTFSSDAFSGSFLSPRKLSTVIGSTSYDKPT
jgi:hypothetical protein